MAETKEDNPFDILAKVVAPAKSYEEARKLVWTAMKSNQLPEDTVITLLISATAMPALAAANIQMERILKSQKPSEPEPTNTLQFPTKEKIN